MAAAAAVAVLLARMLAVWTPGPAPAPASALWVAGLLLVAVLAGGWAARSRPHLLPVLVTALTSTAVTGLATIVLHGTAWSFGGLYSDAAFRTEAVTRFTQSPALSDYAYRGLAAYYPPALPWLEGRLAALLGVPGWTVMKPVALVLAAVVPVLAWLAWRRVLPALPASLVAAASCLATVRLDKPDEWLVLSVALPWWLAVCRGHTSGRSPDRSPEPADARPARWRWLRDGVVLGLMLLVHTYYFLPLGVATVAALGLDLVRRRPLPLRPVRAAAIGAVALVVATPSWWPLLGVGTGSGGGDDLQRRWSPEGFTLPAFPLPTSVLGTLGLVGCLWALAHLRRRPPLGSLLVVLGAGYAVVLGGQLLQPWGVALLPEKAKDLVVATLAATGALALHDLGSLLVGRAEARRQGVRLVAAALATSCGVALLVAHADRWAWGKYAAAAQHMRYPSGGYPAGGPPPAGSTLHPWSVRPGFVDPPTIAVRRAWERLAGRPLDGDTVLVTSRADLLATSPAHPFLTWKSIYSHPHGRFRERLALLREVTACRTPACAHTALRDNRFDAVDGLVLHRDGADLATTVTVDTFPDGWRMVPLRFDASLFRGPCFARRDVGDVAVVRVTTCRSDS